MALSKPADIQRHLQFKKDVDDLRENGCIRHYSSEISRMTGNSSGNICHYYTGRKPFSDNFLKKFKEVYGEELERIRSANKPLLHGPQKIAKNSQVLEVQILRMLDVLNERITRIDQQLQDWINSFSNPKN